LPQLIGCLHGTQIQESITFARPLENLRAALMTRWSLWC
jgi:hypothetical protein